VVDETTLRRAKPGASPQRTLRSPKPGVLAASAQKFTLNQVYSRDASRETTESGSGSVNGFEWDVDKALSRETVEVSALGARW